MAYNPNGYKPTNSLYITKHIGTSVEKILSTDELFTAWQNTLNTPFGWNNGEAYLKDHYMLLIGELLGSDNFTVGFGQRNADVIYHLNWHEGPEPIYANVYEFLDALEKEHPSY